MTEQQKLMKLADLIDRIEYKSNFPTIYFRCVDRGTLGFEKKDVDVLKKLFEELGIKISQERPIAMTGSRIDEYMFEVHSDSNKVVEKLDFLHHRIDAWRTLRGWGGIQMTDDEKAFFAEQDLKMAALKARNAKGLGL